MNKNFYKLGLVSVSFRKSSPKEIMKEMCSAKLSCIEWGSDVHAPYDDFDKLKNIARLQNEYGIFCSSYGTYFRLGETPIEELPKYIAAAKELGTDILRLWCGTECGVNMSEGQKEQLFLDCQQANEIAKGSDVTLCMECHKKTFTENPQDTLKLMKAVNSSNFRMYWQPFQWLKSEENLEIAKLLSPYTKHIHVFHWKDKQRFSLNNGIDEWQEYLKAFSTPRTLLLEFMPNNSIDELKSEAEALRRITEGMK